MKRAGRGFVSGLAPLLAAGMWLLAPALTAIPAHSQTSSGLRSFLDPVDGAAGTSARRATGRNPASTSGSADEDAASRTDDASAATPDVIPDTVPPGRSRTSPNYGRPRPLPDKRLRYPGRRKEARQPLTPLEPYQSSPRSIRNRDPLSGPPPVQYAEPRRIPRKRRPAIEDDPYAPLGINMGAMRVLPFIEASGGYDTNAGQAATGGKGSALTRVDAGFRAFSLWSRHEFAIDVRGGYAKYFSDPNASRPDGTAKATLRLDITRDTALNFELRGTLTTQRPGSPEVNAAVQGRPAIASFGATAGVTQKFGRLETTLSGLADRTQYEDGKLSNGNSVRLSRDNYTALGLRGRVGYEITPGIKPFVEVTADKRERDEPIDVNGFARNSSGIAARVGSTFEISRILTGEISAGYAHRKYDDARLPSLAAGTFDASLIWTASPLTTVTFRAQSLLNETTIAGAAGSVSRTGSVEINHALLRNLNIGAVAMWQNNKYQGVSLTENIMTGTLKAEYKLTRSIAVKGSFTHTRLQSSQPGADYTANVFLLGLRLQR
ncbi:MAG: outer membrane beta-barrel protein [Hyphomicrobiales bacterium]|nr:outer membrane beta-barrel protein [Hyphomicrobiales bacterium]